VKRREIGSPKALRENDPGFWDQAAWENFRFLSFQVSLETNAVQIVDKGQVMDDFHWGGSIIFKLPFHLDQKKHAVRSIADCLAGTKCPSLRPWLAVEDCG
jgi:hypothetical protein